jgi:hypothetical protein
MTYGAAAATLAAVSRLMRSAVGSSASAPSTSV